MNNPTILREIRKNIFIEGTILEKLEKCQEDPILKSQVIQVGEFEN